MMRSFFGATLLTLALAVGATACDSNDDAPDKREDEGGDEKTTKKAEETKEAEAEEETGPSDDGTKATPTPATPNPVTTTAKSDDFKKADTFKKADSGSAATGDEIKKADDGAGTSPIGATPIKSDKREAGSDTGGQCPCRRGLVCCDGVCKFSCS